MKLHKAHIAAPGHFSEIVVFWISLLVMMLLFVIEAATQSQLTMPVMYTVATGAIALHCNRKSLVAAGFLISVSLQIIPMAMSSSYVTYLLFGNMANVVISNLMAMYVAFMARRGFLQMLDESATDPLTGLGNRRALERFAKGIARNGHTLFSVVVLDLDGFKQLNDTYGHYVGDKALRLLADVLRARVRKSDFAARIGGDEFAILLMHAHEKDGETFCAQLLEHLAPTMQAEGLSLTASIGCKTFRAPPPSISEALHLADIAMYEAKKKGKHCAVCH